MKKIDLKKFGAETRKLVLRAPIELAECLLFFAIYEASIFKLSTEQWSMEKMAFMPIVFFISLAANNFFRGEKRRWAYFASIATLVPVLAMNLQPYIGTSGYFFGILLSVFLVLLSVPSRDNSHFARNLTKLLIDVVLSVVVITVAFLALAAIFATISYIFGFWDEWYRHIPLLLYLVILPMTFCYFQLGKEPEEWKVPKFVDVLINYIVCPAVIIYTVILYCYLAKIAVMWELPKGGLAMMILAFYIVALGGKLLQMVSPRRWYAWFYDNFHYISLPLMILFWTGLVYRIEQYSYTESRIYLVVAGVAMLVFSAMMAVRKFSNFSWMLLIASGAIVVFTYIPGISAKSMGIDCQEARMIAIAAAHKAFDSHTGKLIAKAVEDLEVTNKKDYEEIYSCYYYIKDAVGDKEVQAKYGRIDGVYYSSDEDDEVEEENVEDSPEYINPSKYVDCGRYRYYMPSAVIDARKDGIITVTIDDKIVLKEQIDKAKIDSCRTHRVKVLDASQYVYRNDSVMVVLKSISYNGKWFNIWHNDGSVFATHEIDKSNKR